jgi:hypothetical protein
MILTRQRMMKELAHPVSRLRQGGQRVLMIKQQLKATATKTLTSGRSRSGGRSTTKP